jgi:HSP20 family molecular chaperone IbpA
MAEKTIATTNEDQEASQEQTRELERFLTPPVDIYETEDELVVVVDLPGVSRDHLEMMVDRDVLTIRGQVQHARSGQPVDQEYRLMNFFRQFQLSDRIDQNKINAELHNGVATLHLPKAETARPRQIAITTA